MKRRKYLENKRRGIKKSNRLIVYLLLVIILVPLFFIAFVWYKASNLNKFIFVNKNVNTDETELYIVDDKNKVVKKYTIDEEIVVDSSYGFGEYTIKNLWKLSEKEKQGGDIVAKSITKNFYLPVHFYNNKKQTNMDLFHRIRSLAVMKSNQQVVKEIDSLKVVKSVFVDFTNTEIQEQGNGVIVEDLSNSASLVDGVSEIINVLGSKVIDYSKGYDKDLDCEVFGSSQNLLLGQVALVLDCRKIITQEYKNNIKLRIGENFLSRF